MQVLSRSATRRAGFLSFATIVFAVSGCAGFSGKRSEVSAKPVPAVREENKPDLTPKAPNLETPVTPPEALPAAPIESLPIVPLARKI